jgi:hypothetical protein
VNKLHLKMKKLFLIGGTANANQVFEL